MDKTSMLDSQERLYAAVGKLILNWALIDNSLKLAVEVIHSDLEQRGLKPDSIIELRFSGQVNFLRKYYNQYIEDDYLIKESDRVCGVIIRLKDLRDKCAHGSVHLDGALSDVVVVQGSWGDLFVRRRINSTLSAKNLRAQRVGRRVTLDQIEQDILSLGDFAGQITSMRGRLKMALDTRFGAQR